jgi:hypothetical protein
LLRFNNLAAKLLSKRGAYSTEPHLYVNLVLI